MEIPARGGQVTQQAGHIDQPFGHHVAHFATAASPPAPFSRYIFESFSRNRSQGWERNEIGISARG